MTDRNAITRLVAGDSSDEPVRRRFRSSAGAKGITPDAFQRQARTALLAFQTFASRDTALVFLNSFHDDLGGRPIDVAGASDQGADIVAAALRSGAAKAPRD